MGDWQPIETAEKGPEMLFWHPLWRTPGHGVLDSFGLAHATCCGCEFSPQPSHWMPLPQPPSATGDFDGGKSSPGVGR